VGEVNESSIQQVSLRLHWDVFRNGVRVDSMFRVAQFVKPNDTVQAQGAFRREFVDQHSRGLPP